jgi:hypothetical protein
LINNCRLSCASETNRGIFTIPLLFHCLLTIDVASDEPPSQILSRGAVGRGLPVAQADEDDISMLWLTDQTQTGSAVTTLSANESLFGQGEIFAGPSLDLQFNDSLRIASNEG